MYIVDCQLNDLELDVVREFFGRMLQEHEYIFCERGHLEISNEFYERLRSWHAACTSMVAVTPVTRFEFKYSSFVSRTSHIVDYLECSCHIHVGKGFVDSMNDCMLCKFNNDDLTRFIEESKPGKQSQWWHSVMTIVMSMFLGSVIRRIALSDAKEMEE